MENISHVPVRDSGAVYLDDNCKQSPLAITYAIKVSLIVYLTYHSTYEGDCLCRIQDPQDLAV